MNVITFILMISLSLPAFSQALSEPAIQTKFETTPIPEGYDSSDDAAIWLHPTESTKSLILGVSKNKIENGGFPGVGVYNLQGKEVQFLKHNRLNNIDLKYNFLYGKNLIDIAVASNRDKFAISLFSINESGVSLLNVLILKDHRGLKIKDEPYGICLSKLKSNKKFYVFSPMKSGLLYQHEILFYDEKAQLKFIRVIDARQFVSKKLDQQLMNTVLNNVIWKENLPKADLISKLSKKIRNRYQLEGCVSDDRNGFLYVGMENLGVLKIPINNKEIKTEFIATIKKSRSAPGGTSFEDGMPRITNDIEGLAIHHGPKGQGALVVSIQGLDEYAFFDRKSDQYLGSFKLSHGYRDLVTETDGVAILSAPLNADFPGGILVVHDHHNTNGKGKLLKANYKMASLLDIFKFFPKLRYENYIYNPRK